MTTLRLTVINAPADSPLAGQQMNVSVTGTTLGRGANNAIILPDHERIVSSQHASIRHDLGQFVLTDHSTNGTFLNDSPTPIGPEKSVPLQNGDVITMGKYRFQVSLVSAVAAAPVTGSGFLDDLGLSPAPQAAPAPFGSPSAPSQSAADVDDFDKWLEPQAAPARQQDPLWGISNVEHVDTGGFDDINDPLAAIEKAQQNDQPFSTPTSNLLDDDPDWWKNSQQDNATPLNQAFSAPHSIQAEPTPVPPPAPVFEQPPAFAAEAPALPVVDDADNLDALLGLNSTPAAPIAPEPTPVPAPIQWEATPVPPPIVAEPTPVPAAITPESTPVPPIAPRPVAEAPVDTTSRAPTPTGSGDAGELLAQLLELGNLPPEQLQNLPTDISAVLKQTIRGLVDMLRARSSIKNELRIDRTMIRPVENNPLKFALTEKDALRYLFGERSGAYMPGPRAVEEAFADIEQHQVALLAGMRAAYEKMLADFSPAALEKRFGNAVHKGLLGNKKSALWDAYTEYFDKLQQDPEASYNRLFGETFADAYEEQANTIKHGSRDPSRSR